MCAQCDDGFGILVRFVESDKPFVICEGCFTAQRLCSDRCKAAFRQTQCRRARRTYAMSQKGMISRSHINQRYRLRRANNSDQCQMDQTLAHGSDRGIPPPDVARAPEGSGVRAMEGPCHDVHLEVRAPSGAAASEDAGERAARYRLAQGAAGVQPAPPAGAGGGGSNTPVQEGSDGA